jgi:ketosteroid isomerase-like protein
LASFATALCARDAAGASRLLSREACFVTPDSTVIQGRAAVLGFLRQLVGMAAEMTIDQRTMLAAGEVALASESWSLRGRGAAGSVRRTTRATIVLAQIEGAWRIAVVDPWRAP